MDSMLHLTISGNTGGGHAEAAGVGVKGSVHAAIGASTPIGLVITQHVTIFQGVAMAAVSAGYSLLPDIDCRNAAADRALGGAAHKVVHKVCSGVYRSTGTHRDLASIEWARARRWRDPYHRTLTHTIAASLMVGVMAYILTFAGPITAALAAAFGVFLLRPLHRGAAGLVVIGAAMTAAGSALLLNPWLMALAAAGGYLSHIVADACTKGGVPAFWPIPIQGKRWWSIRLLGRAVTSGSSREKGPAIGVSLAANALLVFLQL
jgi:hypothetical protein